MLGVLGVLREDEQMSLRIDERAFYTSKNLFAFTASPYKEKRGRSGVRERYGMDVNGLM